MSRKIQQRLTLHFMILTGFVIGKSFQITICLGLIAREMIPNVNHNQKFRTETFFRELQNSVDRILGNHRNKLNTNQNCITFCFL